MSKKPSLVITVKPFDLKKAKKGKPFTWIEHMLDGRLADESEPYDVLYLVGKSRTDTYGKDTWIIQAKALPGDEDDDCFHISTKDLEKYCCMLPKQLLELDNPEIFTKLGQIQ